MTSTMTLDRRAFLSGSAGLTFSIGVSGVTAVAAGADPADLEINHWVTIGTDGRIHIVFPSTEMGQSSYSTLP